MSYFEQIPLLEITGVIGFVLYMLSYGLLQMGKISGQSYSYTLLNMTAASLVLISLVRQFNLASLLIQLAWILISLVGLYRLWSGAAAAKQNPDVPEPQIPSSRQSIRDPVQRLKRRWSD